MQLDLYFASFDNFNLFLAAFSRLATSSEMLSSAYLESKREVF